MPGLIGFIQYLEEEEAEIRLRKMVDLLEPEDRFQVDLYAEAGMGLGRVSLGILNPEAQPTWNQDKSICIFMEGEFFDTEMHKQNVERRGFTPPGNDIELALALYEIYGSEFASKLNGAFLLAIWDGRLQKLVIANDRLGLYPAYFSRRGGEFQFASGVRALLADPNLSREIDRTALAEFLTFDHVLRQRTLLLDVQLLPQATVLTIQAGDLELNRYWSPTFISSYDIFREEEYYEEFIMLLKQAVRRQTFNEKSPSLLLSGGLDSRMLLGALAEENHRDRLQTFTWGIPRCDDVRFARESARSVGARYHFNELKSDWLLSLADTGSRITDGMGNLVNLHALAVIEEQSQDAQIFYKGFLGDAMFGFGLRPRYWASYDKATRVQVHLEAYRDYDVLTFDLSEHNNVFSDPFLQDVGGQVIEDYQVVMDESDTDQLADQRIYIDFTQRVPRMTILGVEAVRHRAAARLPYCDYDLIDFSLRVPPGLRIDRTVMVEAFIRAFPQLAQIPLTPQGLPLMSCARDVQIRATSWARWHLSRIGLGGLVGPPSRPYSDYASWFRTILRSWVEDTLLAPTCLERGYYKPEFVESMIHEHMAGINHSVPIGAMLSIELWHRSFLD